jgi:N-acetylglucosamine kinase-like BadF-type ATPase
MSMSYLSIDGGGSKCSAIWFDDELNLIGKGLAAGINVTQTPIGKCRENIADCLDRVFATGTPSVIHTVYAILVGPFEILLDELAKRTSVCQTIRFSEPMGCLLAGGLQSEGLVALSGTGSDVFCISGNACYSVGGWGPVLGDQGSGTWIGQRALEAFVKASDGWGAPTMLSDLIRSEWSLDRDQDLIGRIHQSAAPFREVASVAHIVEKAANAGDTVALGILRDAGQLLAEQMICMIRKYPVPAHLNEIILAGGAWKIHPSLLEWFTYDMKAWRSDMIVLKPWFEPTMAGVARFMLDKGMDRAAARMLMAEKFSEYKYIK